MGCTGCSFKDTVINDKFSNYISETKSNSCNKLNTFDWMDDVPDSTDMPGIVEVRFKNTRKEFFLNIHNLKLNKDEFVTVESSNGHDVGIVSLKGRLAELQWKKKEKRLSLDELKSIYRKATTLDIQYWQEAKNMEEQTMLKARQIAKGLNLNMKISDVEYQGDKKKATFYYIADDRVDFRELIKLYAEEFKVKIEMKQIGARQEAALVGGIGSCGRELCCSTWRTVLPSVQQSSIQKQNLSVNADKYLGQCGKLKCCLTYELDMYLEAQKDFPLEILEIETKQGILYPYKTDLLKKAIWYTDKLDASGTLILISLEKVKEITMLNKKGIKVDKPVS